MDQALHPAWADRETSSVRAAVGALKLPDFIEGFDIRLGDFDGDPALWVIFKTNVDDDIDGTALDEHLRSRRTVRDAVETAIYRLGTLRAPFVKFQHV